LFNQRKGSKKAGEADDSMALVAAIRGKVSCRTKPFLCLLLKGGSVTDSSGLVSGLALPWWLLFSADPPALHSKRKGSKRQGEADDSMALVAAIRGKVSYLNKDPGFLQVDWYLKCIVWEEEGRLYSCICVKPGQMTAWRWWQQSGAR
jgi:hypothetical protein